ncbi:MAG: hypothetical protein IPM42_00385 [Saprospiraceae bacterium]|nr:hypothetical protein [Saprospiraceae bacterium]
MKYIIILLLLTLTCSVEKISAQANDFVKAALYQDLGKMDVYNDEVSLRIKTAITKLNDVSLYDWDSKSNTVTFSTLNTKPESPSEIVIFFKPAGGFRTPSLLLNVDTTGKTTAAYFKLSGGYHCVAKYIDSKTSQIIKAEVISLVKDEESFIQIKDYEKEFGGDPAKIKKSDPRKYASLEKKVTEKYEPNFTAFYMGKIKSGVGDGSLFAKNIISSSHDLYEIIPQPNFKEKKARFVEINAGSKNNIQKGENFDVLSKRQEGKYVYYERIASVYIDELKELSCVAKTPFFANKDLAQGLINKDVLYAVKEENTRLRSQLDYNSTVPSINVAFKKSCLFCEFSDELEVIKSPVFNLVERNAPELKYFAGLLKNEKFIDYSIEDLQGQQKGYQILFSKSGEFINATEVSTGKKLSIEESKVKFLGVTLKNGVSTTLLQSILYNYNPDIYNIDWVRTSEVKKDKIKEIIVHNHAGFELSKKYGFFTLVKEDIEGEVIERKNKIAEGKIDKIISINLAKLEIKDGEKELFKADSEKQKILIELIGKN